MLTTTFQINYLCTIKSKAKNIFKQKLYLAYISCNLQLNYYAVLLNIVHIWSFCSSINIEKWLSFKQSSAHLKV